VKAANSVLADGGSEEEAIRACIHAAGKTKNPGGKKAHEEALVVLAEAHRNGELSEPQEVTPMTEEILEYLNADGSFEATKDLLRAALLDIFPVTTGPNGYIEDSPYITATFPDHVVVEYQGKYYSVDYTIDKDGNVTWGEKKDAHMAWSVDEEDTHHAMLLEGWLPAGTSQNDLDDGDFAWLSNAYSGAPKAKKTKMNKAANRKLPYKIHGKVNREGWKAAWIAAANQTARHPSFSGGPGQKAVLAKLRRDKPEGIEISKDNSITDTTKTKKKGKAKENMPPRTVLLSHDYPPEVLVLEENEEGGVERLRYKGVALVDYVLFASIQRCSSGGNKHIYGGWRGSDHLRPSW
jgi:hypothetical protein